MKDVYVLDAIRTPIGRYSGALATVRPDDLAAFIIAQLMERNSKIKGKDVEDVILGCANQAGEDNRNVARMALLLAGLPVEVAGNTVNRLCASGIQAIMDAARGVMCEEGSVYIAGGVESMTRAPFSMAKPSTAFHRVPEIYDTTIGWRFTNQKLANMYYPYSMGETAENVVDKFHVTREEQDDFAFRSQQKYKDAFEDGRFNDEIIPVEVPLKSDSLNTVFSDEHPRMDTSMERLSELKPAFKEDGSVTAGNSSGINDGAAVLLLASGDVVKEKKLKPMAKIISMAVAGVNPDIMGTGPIPATQKALERAGLKMDDIDLIELNEAFAAQSIACIRELELKEKKVNVNGGAIALGHPLGASGARICTTLLHEMGRRKDAKLGLATMCVGVGQGAAMIFEKA